MGKKVEIKRASDWVAKIGRDGNEFAHYTENLRDAILAEAANIEFGVHGIYEGTPGVARRRISDDGIGMDIKVLHEVYSDISVTGTTRDFEITLGTDGLAEIKTVVASSSGDKYHSRNGTGSRASCEVFNRMGTVTVSFSAGTALMTWMYRDIHGEIQMRCWDHEGRYKHIIEPYSEPDVLTKSDLQEDVDFAHLLLMVTGKVTTSEDANRYIASMSDSDEIDNPFGGIEWDGDVIPAWIANRYDEETGLWMRADGTPAHGTIKVLLGNTPWDHTALNGDPAFLNEAAYTLSSGFGNRFWFDLRPWNVVVQAVREGAREGYPDFTLVGHGETVFRLDGGSFTPGYAKPSGRTQHGAYGIRTKADEVEYQTVIDIGKYGQAILIVRKDAGASGTWQTNRRGVVNVVYGNEVFGLYDSSNQDTQEIVFRNMGIPVYSETSGRVSVFLMLPRASETTEGIFQPLARDRIKWSGREDLPLHGDDGIFKAVANALPQEFVDHLEASVISKHKAVEITAKFKNLVSKSKALAAEGARLLSGETGSTVPGLIETEGGEEPGTVAGSQGKSGDTERPVCPECGLKIHAEDCSRKPKPSVGGCGGTDGPTVKLVPDADGKSRGRKSRVKVKSSAEVLVDIDPNPPKFKWEDVAADSDAPEFPVVYTAGVALPDTGRFVINRNHKMVKRLYGVANGAKRDPLDTVRVTEEWIEQNLAEALFGQISASGQDLYTDPVKGRQIRSYGDLSTALNDPEPWRLVTGMLYMQQESLKGYVKRNAAAPHGTRTKPKLVTKES